MVNVRLGRSSAGLVEIEVTDLRPERKQRSHFIQSDAGKWEFKRLESVNLPDDAPKE